ncbi:hypothetical protein R3P38DRAFT_3448046 [Favolaschia claudopus]|uniref:Uncharacterized protein n=1 Tax=Favolaschia claudopus TaxID=2862362 RepID=A0AAW0CTF6_9AGAR
MPGFDTHIKRAVHNAIRQVHPDFPQHLAAIQSSSRAMGEEVLDSRALVELTVEVFTYRFVVGSNIPLFLCPVVKTHVLCAKLYQALLRTHWTFIHDDDSPDLLYLFLGVMRLHSESRAATWLSEVLGPLIKAVVSGYNQYHCNADQFQILRRRKKDEDRVEELQKVVGLLRQIPPSTPTSESLVEVFSVESISQSISENDTVSEEAHPQPEQLSQDIAQPVPSAVTLASEVDAADEEEIENALRLRDCPRLQADNDQQSLPRRLFKTAHRTVSAVAIRTRYQLRAVREAFSGGDILAYVEGLQSALGIGQAHVVNPHHFRRSPAPSPPRHCPLLPQLNTSRARDYKLHRPLTQGIKAKSRKARIYASSRA